MSWYSKVVWSEGLFLRPHHLQQNDRYLEHLVEKRVRHVTPYPWGFSQLEIDRDLAQQSKFAVRRAAGDDAGRHAVRHPGRQPDPRSDRRAGRRGWPDRLADDADRCAEHARSRRGQRRQRQPLYPRRRDIHRLRPPRCASRRRSTSPIRGWPSNCARRQSPATSGSASRASSRCATRRSCSTRSSCRRCWSARPIRSSTAGSTASSAGSTTSSRSLRATPSIHRRAAGCRASTISCCSCSTGKSPCSNHFQRSGYVHPERLYEELLRLAGELATFATPERRARRLSGLRSRRSRKRLRAADARHPGFPERAARPPRDPPRNHRARAERVRFADPRPFAVPQRDVRARGRGAPAAGRNPERFPAPVQGRPQHQDERDRARQSAGRAAGASADAAAAYPRHHRSRLFLSRPQVAAVARVQQRSSIGMHFSGDWPELELYLWAILEDRR